MSSGALSYLAQAIVDRNKTELDGEIISRPALLISDGDSLTYGCDVDIGQKQFDANSATETTAPLRNVPLATGAHNLRYADVGQAVQLRRGASGRWEIVGFSKRKPGTYERTAVTIPAATGGPPVYVIGSAVAVGLSSRVLTLDELRTVGPGFGVTPLGAVGIFRGTALIEVK